MDWKHNGNTYLPSNKIKGIVYKMSYNGKVYYGKKVIKDTRNKPVNYIDYYGSGKAWKEFILGNEDKVKREVLYECVGKSEMHYYECAVICKFDALFDPDCFNGNLNLTTTRAHANNFINKPARFR